MFMLKVNQVDLLRRAIRPFADLGDRANINYSPDFMMMQTATPDFNVLAVLVIKSESFAFFSCNEQEGVMGINPRILDNILNDNVGAEWSLSIHADAGDRTMRFFFRNDSQGITRNHRINLLNEVPFGRFDITELGVENFKAMVGIPSGDFRNNLVLLSSGAGGLVNVYITHNLLKLSTVDTEIILTKESGQCQIIDVAENDQPIEFSFSLEHMAAYQNASLMSSIVWITTPEVPAGAFMLDFPVGLLGNILFFLAPDI